MGYDYHEDIKDFQENADRDARYEAAFDYAVDERGEEVERERERAGTGRSDSPHP